MTLKDASGNVIDCESCQVGIREISKAPKQLLVNGHPVVIRGVNRHEHHPRLGKTNLESCMVKVMRHDLSPQAKYLSACFNFELLIGFCLINLYYLFRIWS